MAGDGGEGDDAAVTKAGLQAANATTSQRRRNPPARAPHTGTRQAPRMPGSGRGLSTTPTSAREAVQPAGMRRRSRQDSSRPSPHCWPGGHLSGRPVPPRAHVARSGDEGERGRAGRRHALL